MAINNTTLSSLVLRKMKFTCGMRFVMSKKLVSSVNSSGWLLRYLAISLDKNVLVDGMDIWNWLPLALWEVDLGGLLVMEEMTEGRFSLEVDALEAGGDSLVVDILGSRGCSLFGRCARLKRRFACGENSWCWGMFTWRNGNTSYFKLKVTSR